MKKNYVVGFAFNEAKTRVVLIIKNKPDWQRGKLNGVGGKIEEGETVLRAMCREFKEETGVTTVPEDWRHYATLDFPEASLKCLTMADDIIRLCRTKEEEEICILPVAATLYLSANEMIPNLRVLIPMARDPEFHFAAIEAVVR